MKDEDFEKAKKLKDKLIVLEENIKDIREDNFCIMLPNTTIDKTHHSELYEEVKSLLLFKLINKALDLEIEFKKI